MRTFRLIVVSISLLSLACPAASAGADDAGRRSGADVVAQWLGKEKHQQTPAELHETQFIDGYLAGVADATEGKDWCNDRGTKSHEIDAISVWAMRDLPKRELETKPAAKLMVQLLAKRYPCGKLKETQ